MTIDSDKILHDLLNSLDSLEGIRPGEIPNIALYMDQVTPFMDAQLDHGYPDTARPDHRSVFRHGERLFHQRYLRRNFPDGKRRNCIRKRRSSKKSGCIQVHVRQLTGGGPGISPALFVYLSAEFRCLSEKTDDRAHGG